MDIDQHILKLIGTAQLEEELLIGHDLHLNATANVYKREEVDNGDGTVNVVYKAKLLTVQVRNDLGVLIKSSAKKKQSQAMRFAIEAYRQEHAPERDEEEFYTMVMNKIMINLDGIISAFVKE